MMRERKVLINATLIDMTSGEFKKNQAIVIEDGRIMEISEKENRFIQSEVIDVQGKIVTPGLINPFCHIGLKENGLGWEGDDSNELSGPKHPSLLAYDGIYPFDSAFSQARQEGITTVHVSPGPQNIIGGQTTILKTNGLTVEDMVVEKSFGLSISLGELAKTTYRGKNNLPMTRMGIASLLREKLKKTIYEHESEPIWRNVLEKRTPLIIQCHRSDDLMTAIRLKKEFNIDVYLVHATEAQQVVEEIKKEQIPLIVGPFFQTKMRFEQKNLTPSSVRKFKKYHIPFLFCSTITKNLGLEGSLLMKENYSFLEILKKSTIESAELLKINHRVGTIAPGKDADLVIWNGVPFELLTTVEATFIQGEVVYQREEKEYAFV